MIYVVVVTTVADYLSDNQGVFTDLWQAELCAVKHKDNPTIDVTIECWVGESNVMTMMWDRDASEYSATIKNPGV